MGLFTRRRPDPEPMVRGVGIAALSSPVGWTIVVGRQAQARRAAARLPDVVVAPGDRLGLVAALPAALQQSLTSALAGGGSRPLPADIVRHDLIGDWVRATESGVRRFSVSAGEQGLTVLRWGLTVSMQSGTAELDSVGDGPSAKLMLRPFDDWRRAIGDASWFALPVWNEVASFLEANADASGLVSAWWVPDLLDRAVGIGPLRPEHAKGHATSFRNGTEEVPDLLGPPGVGFADPGVTGRWLWLHRWTPFDGRPPTEAFTGAVGLVCDESGTVRCFLWPERETVQRVAVLGQHAWPAADRRVSDLYTRLAGTDDVPSDWEVTQA